MRYYNFSPIYPADFYVENVSTLSLTSNTFWGIKDCPHLETRHQPGLNTRGQCSDIIERILYFRCLFADSGLDYPLVRFVVRRDSVSGIDREWLIPSFRAGSTVYGSVPRAGYINSTACWSLGFASLQDKTASNYSRRILRNKVSGTQNDLRTSDTQK